MTYNLRSRVFQRPPALIAMSFLMVLGLALAGCTTASSDSSAAPSYEQQLAEHLTAEGATMYGAFWCPHCADQKALFGDAVKAMPYVECAAEGENAQPQLCQEKDIRGYPTWEIEGEFYPGVHSLEALAALSGFQGE